MKDNYKSWALDYKDFYALSSQKERFEFLLRFGLLAPSSHNSQPWRFAVVANHIIIYPEESRTLMESDKNGRQLYLSLGAAIQNILTSAEFFGYETSVRYMPAEFAGSAAAVTLRETDGKNSKDERLIKAIMTRHSNRDKYLDRRLPGGFVNSLESLSVPDLKVLVISEKKVRDKLAEVVTDAIIEAMDDDDFRRELSDYIRPNITKQKTGMPMFGFGMPTIPSLFASQVLRRFNLNKLSRKQDLALLTEHTPYFVLILSVRDDEESWMRSGQLFENIALMAEMEGINTAPMAAAIQIGENYKKLQLILRTSLRPQMFFRMGYSKSIPPHSPRLSLEDVLSE